jgi:hypothetical protein
MIPQATTQCMPVSAEEHLELQRPTSLPLEIFTCHVDALFSRFVSAVFSKPIFMDGKIIYLLKRTLFAKSYAEG